MEKGYLVGEGISSKDMKHLAKTNSQYEIGRRIRDKEKLDQNIK